MMAFLSAAGVDIQARIPISGLLLLVFPLSGVWWLILKSGCGLRLIVYPQIVADLIVEGGIVYFTGGAQSHLAVLFLMTIFLAGMLLCARGAVVAATGSTLFFVGASLLEQAHFRTAVADNSQGGLSVNMIVSIVLQIVFFYLVAVLTGYVSRKVRAFGARLRLATTELEKAKMDTHLIIESMSSGLITVDSGYRISEFNRSASRILGIKPEQARYRDIRDVIESISPQLCEKIVRAIERGLPEERGEVVATTSAGRTTPLGISVSLLSGGAGTSSGAVVVFQDLTEVKSMAERIRLADRLAALGELSAAIAHEIRTPLASICGSIEMLRDSLAPVGENGRLVDLVIKESDRLRKKIDYFLQFARSRPVRFGEVCVNSTLAEVVCLVKNHPHFTENTTIDIDAKATATAWADEETIKQVFYNLALNAIEAVGPSGNLKITVDAPVTHAGHDYARVSFADDGAGIGEDDLGRIFEPFYTKKATGTGLGLAIAAKIVEDHSGILDVKSNEGVGTVATVYLPLDKETAESGYPGAGSSQRLAETADT